MRIGIDVRYLSHGIVGGVHTYVQHFVPALAAVAAEHSIFLYADTKRPFELSSLPGNVSLRLLPWSNPLSSLYHDLFMQGAMAQDGLDVAHFPANYGFGPAGARTVITVHDAINLMPLREIIRGHRKKAKTIALMTYLHYCTLAAVQRADMVLTVSAHAAREIARYLPRAQSRIVPVPHGVPPDLRRITDRHILEAVRRRYDLHQPFVLADALKNPGLLLQAWQQLPPSVRNGKTILFFSRRADPPAEVWQAAEAGRAKLLVGPPRADLIALYSLAEAFVFPSWIEGFGIPILEAMACGAPVIASDRGAIPEVAGGAALLVDAKDAAVLAQHLAAVLGETTVAEKLRERGFRRAAQFSWPRTAASILDSYCRVVAA